MFIKNINQWNKMSLKNKINKSETVKQQGCYSPWAMSLWSGDHRSQLIWSAYYKDNGKKRALLSTLRFWTENWLNKHIFRDSIFVFSQLFCLWGKHTSTCFHTFRTKFYELLWYIIIFSIQFNSILFLNTGPNLLHWLHDSVMGSKPAIWYKW